MTETELVNMALNRVGALRVNDFPTDNSAQGRVARLHYYQTRDALLRSYDWPFARKRVQLSQDTEDPDFEWDNQFLMPSDFLGFRESHEESQYDKANERWEIEGDRFMTNDAAVYFKYIRRVENPTEFDPLFTELMILTLAKKFIPALCGTKAVLLTKDINEDLKLTLRRVRTFVFQENNTSGRRDWMIARTLQTDDPSRM